MSEYFVPGMLPHCMSGAPRSHSGTADGLIIVKRNEFDSTVSLLSVADMTKYPRSPGVAPLEAEKSPLAKDKPADV